MSMFFWNLLLAVTWAAMTANVTALNLIVGFLLGYVILWFCQLAIRPSNYFAKVPQLIRFLGFYLWELFLANLRVAYDVITPPFYMRPGIIAIPLDVETDAEISLLANLITLTPGTLSLDVSDDRKVLYIHAMYVDDPDTLRREIKQGLERRVLEVCR